MNASLLPVSSAAKRACLAGGSARTKPCQLQKTCFLARNYSQASYVSRSNAISHHLRGLAARVSAQAEAGPGSHIVSENPQFNEHQNEQLWRGVSRALMKLGKDGAKESHARSLLELLNAHSIVKIKFNGDPAKAGPAAKQLADLASGAILLEVKGSYMLFARAGIPPESLLALAAEQAAKISRFNEKQAGVKQSRSKSSESPAGASPQKPKESGGRGAGRRPEGPPSKQSGSNIDDLISKVSKKGMSRSTLVSEWAHLEEEIVAAELEDHAKERSSKESPKKWNRSGLNQTAPSKK